MPHLRGLDENAGLYEVFRMFPEHAGPLLTLSEAIMRGPSPFSAGQRELMAAYVSGLNACSYCRGIHARLAEAFGLDGDLLESLIADPEAAPVEAKLRPVFAYLRRLTLEPASIREADVEAIRAAGWEDNALVSAVSVGALFNCMNRLVEGLGVEADEAYWSRAADRLAEISYGGLASRLQPGAGDDDTSAAR